MGEQQAVLYEVRDGVAWITLNTPERRNVLSSAVGKGLHDAFARVAAEDEVRAVVLTGTDPSFCAGADIKDPGTHADATIADYLSKGHIGHFDMTRLRQPIIGAVNGHCFGAGFELALACDILIASEQATFGIQHIRYGLYPAGGGAARFTQAVGKYRAMYYIMTGERFDAPTAFELGVLSKVVPHTELLPAAEECARTIAGWSPVVVRYAKECVHGVFEQPLAPVLEADQYRNFSLYHTGDREEGHKAFVEGRQPDFRGE
jgi:enoyl-CoA hydratase/carnithine racemase